MEHKILSKMQERIGNVVPDVNTAQQKRKALSTSLTATFSTITLHGEEKTHTKHSVPAFLALSRLSYLGRMESQLYEGSCPEK